MKKLNGFTLSEILIAMLVLGIIIAASVPVILNLTPNKNGIMMKKAYYATETIIHSLVNDAEYYPETDDNTKYGFANQDSVTIAGTGQSATGANKAKCLFASKLNIKEDLATVCNGTTTTVTTMDGMVWNLAAFFSTTGAASGTINIDVDGLGTQTVNAYSYVASSKNLGRCTNATTWGLASCNIELKKREHKKFDRIEIKIAKDGKLSIDSRQTDLLNILSGKTKLIGGDDD